VYAALRTLGRRGLRELVERCCAHARRMGDALRQHAQVRVLNEIVLNQVLVQLVPPAGDPRDDTLFTQDVVASIQREGTCWLGMSRWQGRPVARISICNWSTTEEDIDRSAAAILDAVEQPSGR
jgi:glutamate/tyrosine decarboxylase-like PLP-dependent enzyme